MEDSNDAGFEGFKELMTCMVKGFAEAKDSAEEMARAVNALSDAQSFEALVSICAELVWMRKQMAAALDIFRRLGPEHVGVFMVAANMALHYMRDGSPVIDPVDVLRKKEEEGNG